MPNMDYCRFHNTRQDFEECLEHLHHTLSEPEHEERFKLMHLCKDLMESIGVTINPEEFRSGTHSLENLVESEDWDD